MLIMFGRSAALLGRESGGYIPLVKRTLQGALLCALIFVIVEGISSIIFVAYTVLPAQARPRGLSEVHVLFDSELGWVSVPNCFEKDYYAPGIYLKTNSRGFRADSATTDGIPAGKLRVVCSGDSQTFGDGVANDHAWCQVLETLDSRLQTVNIGEAGYGVDQMYLKYKRAGAALDRDVHLLAFITDDIRRMHYTVMSGYGKPILQVRNGEIVSTRAFVAQRPSLLHFLAQKPNPLRQFRFVTVVGDLMDRIKGSSVKGPEVPTDEERVLVLKLMDDLAAMEKSKNGILALVYLPTRHDDYAPGGPSDLWRQFLREESPKRGVVFIDLVEDFEKLPVTTKDGMFIWQGFTENFPETPGHFDDQGHQYLARQIYAKMLAVPAIAGKLARLNPVPTGTLPHGQSLKQQADVNARLEHSYNGKPD